MTLKEQILKVMHNKLKRTYQIKELFEGYYGADKIDIQITCDGTNPMKTDKTWEDIMFDKICNAMNERYGINAFPNLSKEDMNVTDERIGYAIDSVTHGVTFTAIVYFPRVRIENEHKRWHMIEKLFVSVPFFPLSGHLRSRFYYTRSKYTIREVLGYYMHSHVSGTNLSDPSEFSSVCTGSGPINETMRKLEDEFDEELWTLFCWELDKAVHVESLAGGPYMYLERIGGASQQETHVENLNVLKYESLRYNSRYRKIINDFLKDFLREKRLKFKYVNHNYVLGMLYKDYVIEISNSFIDWVNNRIGSKAYYDNSLLGTDAQQLTFTNILRFYRMMTKVVIKGDKIYEVSDNPRNDVENYRNRYVVTFKGKEQNLEIVGNTDEGNDNYVLNSDICNYILDKILKFVNRNYGKNKVEIAKDVKYV